MTEYCLCKWANGSEISLQSQNHGVFQDWQHITHSLYFNGHSREIICLDMNLSKLQEIVKDRGTQYAAVHVRVSESDLT